MGNIKLLYKDKNYDLIMEISQDRRKTTVPGTLNDYIKLYISKYFY